MAVATAEVVELCSKQWCEGFERAYSTELPHRMLPAARRIRISIKQW